MIIGVCSDIHDNIWALERALPQMDEAQALVFCGDFCAPFTLVQLAEGAGDRPLHVVWGNNDGDRHLLTSKAADFSHVTVHGELARIELGGLRVAINHYPDIAVGLADSGQYNLVFYGHDHVAHEEIREPTGCLLHNPGEIMGRLGSPSVSLVDSDSRRARMIGLLVT